MLNLLQSQSAKIIQIKDEASSVKLFRLSLKKKISFQPGQIIFVSVPGFGEAPFAICSRPDDKDLEFCVRQVGRLTAKLHSFKIGDNVLIRGPYGNSWPTFAPLRGASVDKPLSKNRNYLFVVGGLGLLPLRSLILGKDKLLGPNSKIQIFYGAKSPNEFLFQDEFDEWREKGVDLNLTIDKTCPPWGGCVGPVTILFDKICPIENALCFLCGPPIMYKFVIEKLKKCNYEDKDIYMSLERRMHCGIGVCQHCAVGSKYVCKDGPIFNYEKLKTLPDMF